MAEAVPYEAPPHGWRTFLIVWITQSVSQFGSALTQFALNIWLLKTAYPLESQKSELALALSAINIAFAIPIVFGAPIAGAFADRHDRKRIMIAMDTLNGFTSLALLALIYTATLNIYLLVVISAINAAIIAFHGAAFDTSYAMIVPAERLPRANGMMQTSWALSGILAPGAAAAIISLPALARSGVLPGFLSILGAIQNGAALAIGLDGLSFFLAALIPLFLFIPSPQRAELAEGKKVSMWADIGEGFRYIWYRRSFLWLLGTFTVANFVGGLVGILMTMIVRFQLQPDWLARGFTIESTLAMLGTAGGIGGLIGGVLVSTWGGLKRHRVLGVLVPMILGGLGTVALGLARNVYLGIVTVGIESAMVPVMNAHSQAIWQTQTPREKQGRVFSVRRLIAQFSWPASSFLAGLLAAAFDPGMITVVAGSVLILWCIFGLFNPALMRVEDTAWIEAQAKRYEAARGKRAEHLSDEKAEV